MGSGSSFSNGDLSRTNRGSDRSGNDALGTPSGGHEEICVGGSTHAVMALSDGSAAL